MGVSTKECLEDLIGQSSDHVSRDAKKHSGGMPERTVFYNATSSRHRARVARPVLGLHEATRALCILGTVVHWERSW